MARQLEAMMLASRPRQAPADTRALALYLDISMARRPADTYNREKPIPYLK